MNNAFLKKEGEGKEREGEKESEEEGKRKWLLGKPINNIM